MKVNSIHRYLKLEALGQAICLRTFTNACFIRKALIIVNALKIVKRVLKKMNKSLSCVPIFS